MAASYPGSIKSYTTKTDGVDFYLAAHMNSVQEEIVAVQTLLGANGNKIGINLIHVRDEKASGTAGGTFTAGAWQTRTLNTVSTNTLTGSSLASNQITLPAGTYDVFARAPGYVVSYHQAKLRNVTDGSDAIIGTTENSGSSEAKTTTSFVIGRFTIAGTKAFELQHYCSPTTVATYGFGYPVNFGVIEVYAEIQIRRVA